MMRQTMVLALTLVHLSAASPSVNSYPQYQTLDSTPRPHVIRYEMETANMPNSYKFSYDTSNGESRREEGAILNPGTKEAALDVLGSVRWYDNKGQLYEMSYKAGKRGYRTIIRKVKS